MDWLKALLKAQGLDDAAIEKIIADAGKELPKHYMPKDKYNEEAEARKKAEKDVSDRDKQIETLKTAAGSNIELQKQIEQLQADNKTAAEKHEAALKDIKISGAIEKALTDAKAKHPDLLLGKIDKTKLVLDGDKVVGLDDQIKPLKESYKELFETENPNPNPTPPGFHVGGGGNPTPPATGASLKDAIQAHFQTQK